jgi:hypothetical protein
MAFDRRAVLERFFPSLRRHSYRVTSPNTRRYNCTAWANSVASKWWEALPGYFWPGKIPRDGTVDTYIKLFSLCGFERCPDASLEHGVERIAIYAIGYSFKHVARQLPDGKWTSKLGALEDIEHDRLDALVGDEYGQVVAYMKRNQGNDMVGRQP